MDILKKRVLKDGKIINGGLLDVSSFLNQMIDIQLLSDIGKAFSEIFIEHQPTKVITIESSGISMAIACSLELKIPCVIARKCLLTNSLVETYNSEVFSHTKQKNFNICVSKNHITETDRVLIIDDFLACGNAANGLINIVEEAKATVIGVGICVEKSFQNGADKLISQGVNLHSLVKIKSLDNGVITI